MLLETIRRNDKSGQVKLVCIEVLRAKGQTIPVESVPTLITLPERYTLTGKAVFDYLLLPGKGKLLTPVNKPNEAIDETSAGPPLESTDPIAFSIGSISGFGDNFTDINHQGNTIDVGNTDRLYNWTLIADQEKAPMAIGNFAPEETRTKKPSIDLETFKMHRDMDLQQNDLNTTLVIPPSFTR